MPTFADAAVTAIEQERGGWRSPRQATDWLGSLDHHVFPGIGCRPVSEVNSADVLAVLTPLWRVKMQTARTLRERIRAVLEWVISMEYRADDPCDSVLPVLGPQREVVRHMRALPHRDVAVALEAVRAARSTSARSAGRPCSSTRFSSRSTCGVAHQERRCSSGRTSRAS